MCAILVLAGSYQKTEALLYLSHELYKVYWPGLCSRHKNRFIAVQIRNSKAVDPEQTQIEYLLFGVFGRGEFYIVT